jgi:bifunctional non-homologous end joining protein LigD
MAGCLSPRAGAVSFGSLKNHEGKGASPKSKLTKPIKKPKATWVEPSFVADVEYRDITSEGLLRQSSFKGLTNR